MACELTNCNVVEVKACELTYCTVVGDKACELTYCTVVGDKAVNELIVLLLKIRHVN